MTSQGQFGVVRIDFVLNGIVPPHLFLYDLRYCSDPKLKAIVQYPESLERSFPPFILSNVVYNTRLEE